MYDHAVPFDIVYYSYVYDIKHFMIMYFVLIWVNSILNLGAKRNINTSSKKAFDYPRVVE